MDLARHEQAQLAQISGWQEDLTVPQARIAPHFARPEVRDRAGRVIAGFLAPRERRNGWQVAEHLVERSSDGVQRLLRTARWDAEAVRDDPRDYVVEHLGDPAQFAFRLHWSRWRRQRQAEARRCHHKRRLARSDPDVPL